MRALIEKELRENIRWLPLGLILISILTWYAMPQSSVLITPIASNLVNLVGLGAAVFALALGILQSALDLRNGAYAYLVHRSVSMRQIIGAKLISGFLLYTVAVGIPLVVVAVWLQWQGLQIRPVRPAQIVPVMVMSLACFLVHPTAMIVLARPSRWFGTKLLPVVPVIFLVCSCSSYLMNAGLAKAFIPIPFIVCVAIPVVFATFHAWCGLPTESLLPFKTLMRFSMNLQLFIASILLCFTAVVFCMGSVVSLAGPDYGSDDFTYENYVVDLHTGKPWYVTEKHIWENNALGGQLVPQSGSQIKPSEYATPTGELPTHFKKSVFGSIMPTTANWQLGGDGFFANAIYTGTRRNQLIYDRRGFLLAYSLTVPRGLRAVIAADGIHRSTDIQGDPFGQTMSLDVPTDSIGYEVPGETYALIVNSGVLSLGRNLEKMVPFLDAPIDWMSSNGLNTQKEHGFLIASRGILREYRWKPRVTDSSSREANNQSENAVQTPAVPTYELEEVRELTLPTLIADDAKQISKQAFQEVALFDDGYVFFDRTHSRFAVVRFAEPSAPELLSFKQSRPKPPESLASTSFMALFPIGFYAVAGIIASIVIEEPINQLHELSEMWGLIFAIGAGVIIVTILSAVLTWNLCRRRGLGRGVSIAWTLSALLIGIATPLAVTAIYRRVYYEACPKCDRARRIDLRLCPNCKAAWEPLPADGIEILSSADVASGRRLQSAMVD